MFRQAIHDLRRLSLHQLYAMTSKDEAINETNLINPQQFEDESSDPEENGHKAWSRIHYTGSLLFNITAFILPALYATLAKLWVAKIDSSAVVTTDVFTYIGIISEVLNEGLPRASWNIIGDKSNRSLASRRGISYTLIIVQSMLGLVMSIAIVTAAQQFANTFVPEEVRAVSLTYVRISGFSALSSALETAVAAATRALDQPDVPLIIGAVKFAVNIILDMILISKFHVSGITPNVNTQAATQLACGLAASFSGLLYFLWTTRRRLANDQSRTQVSARPSLHALVILAKPGAFTFLESAIRNALYLWLVSGVVALGSDYATAWGVFNTIRWGLVMVPVQALEATSLAFVGHAWGIWRHKIGTVKRRPVATRKDLMSIIRPALCSCAIALAIEVPICLFLSFYGARRFAMYLSEDMTVASITEKMWKTIDWCYIFYAVSTQLATILLATRPRWYLYQSLVSNLVWVLPWAVVVTKINVTADDAWKYHSIVFGGSLVFSFIDIMVVNVTWAWTLLRGKMTVSPVDVTTTHRD